MEKKKASSTNGAGITGYWHVKNANWSISITMHKFKFKWININPSTLNFIEEKVGSSLEHISTADHFLNRTSVAQTLREKINKWDLLKLRSFCKSNDMVNKTKWLILSTEWKKTFTQPTLNRSPKYTINSRNQTSKEQIIQ